MPKRDYIALLIGSYYTFVQFRALLAIIFNCIALAIIGLIGADVSGALPLYSGRHFPLVDQQLMAADRFLGFDWEAVLKFFDRYPHFDTVLRFAYTSVMMQIVLIMILLTLTQRAERLYRLLIAMNIALLITCVVTVFTPAIGPYGLLGLTPADHPHTPVIVGAKMNPAIFWLRSAVFAVPPPPRELGLINFPSYHTTVAIIFVWVSWRLRFVGWPLLVLNALMLFATPIQGNHYLVDTFGGGVVAIIAIAITKWMVAYATRVDGRTPVLDLFGALRRAAVAGTGSGRFQTAGDLQAKARVHSEVVRRHWKPGAAGRAR